VLSARTGYTHVNTTDSEEFFDEKTSAKCCESCGKSDSIEKSTASSVPVNVLNYDAFRHTDPPEFPSGDEVAIDSEDGTGFQRSDSMNDKYIEQSWEQMCSDMLCSLALTPSMSAWYAELVNDLLTSALETAENVQKVNFVQCSFPCVQKEQPKLKVLRWDGMKYGEFELIWTPSSWWIAASLQASLGCQLIVTLRSLSIRGIVRTALSYDCSALRFSFCSMPKLTMKASSQIVVGSVPLPVQDWTERLIIRKIHEIVRRYLVESERVIILRRPYNLSLTDEDFVAAEKAAMRAVSITNAKTTK